MNSKAFERTCWLIASWLPNCIKSAILEQYEALMHNTLMDLEKGWDRAEDECKELKRELEELKRKLEDKRG